MKDGKTGVERALFRSSSEAGTDWLFVIVSDVSWKITRTGEQVETGATDTASLCEGVLKYLLLTRVKPAAASAPRAGANRRRAVEAQLARIERGSAASTPRMRRLACGTH
jgi:hypothetical protein